MQVILSNIAKTSNVDNGYCTKLEGNGKDFQTVKENEDTKNTILLK